MGINYQELKGILEKKANMAISHLDELKCFVPEFKTVLDSVLYISETLNDLKFLDTECPHCKEQKEPKQPSQQPQQETPEYAGMKYESHLTDSNEPRFVLFYSKSCSPCQYLKPILEKYTSDYKIPIEMIDVDEEAGLDSAKKHNIKAWPTLFAVVDGKIQNYKIGADMSNSEEKTISILKSEFATFLSRYRGV